jgi:hypothetical protein
VSLCAAAQLAACRLPITGRFFCFRLPATGSLFSVLATGYGLPAVFPALTVQPTQPPRCNSRQLSVQQHSRLSSTDSRACDTHGRLHLFQNHRVTSCRVRQHPQLPRNQVDPKLSPGGARLRGDTSCASYPGKAALHWREGLHLSAHRPSVIAPIKTDWAHELHAPNHLRDRVKPVKAECHRRSARRRRDAADR